MLTNHILYSIQPLSNKTGYDQTGAKRATHWQKHTSVT
uniref:Uncharacterized protein n=1 Tax=Anguilla anguilla TaxID=7936 RepID=A0A0E9VCD8_ANGAN